VVEAGKIEKQKKPLLSLPNSNLHFIFAALPHIGTCCNFPETLVPRSQTYFKIKIYPNYASFKSYPYNIVMFIMLNFDCFFLGNRSFDPGGPYIAVISVTRSIVSNHF
jgi:hypothetical protein